MLHCVSSASAAHRRPSTTSVTSAQPHSVRATLAKRLAKPSDNSANWGFSTIVFSVAVAEKQYSAPVSVLTSSRPALNAKPSARPSTLADHLTAPSLTDRASTNPSPPSKMQFRRATIAPRPGTSSFHIADFNRALRAASSASPNSPSCRCRVVFCTAVRPGFFRSDLSTSIRRVALAASALALRNDLRSIACTPFSSNKKLCRGEAAIALPLNEARRPEELTGLAVSVPSLPVPEISSSPSKTANAPPPPLNDLPAGRSRGRDQPGCPGQLGQTASFATPTGSPAARR